MDPADSSSFSHLALPDPPLALIVKKPFLASPSKGSVYQSLEAAFQHQTTSTQQGDMVYTVEQIKFVQFLEKLNPGLGGTAGVLAELDIKNEEQVRALSTQAWTEICQTKVRLACFERERCSRSSF